VVPLALLISRKTSKSTRDVIFDITRADARHAGGVMAVGARIGMYESGCWKKLNDCSVRLSGKNVTAEMIIVVVRHGQKNPL
jgi:hypothetical protein